MSAFRASGSPDPQGSVHPTGCNRQRGRRHSPKWESGKLRPGPCPPRPPSWQPSVLRARGSPAVPTGLLLPTLFLQLRPFLILCFENFILSKTRQEQFKWPSACPWPSIRCQVPVCPTTALWRAVPGWAGDRVTLRVLEGALRLGGRSADRTALLGGRDEGLHGTTTWSLAMWGQEPRSETVTHVKGSRSRPTWAPGILQAAVQGY